MVYSNPGQIYHDYYDDVHYHYDAHAGSNCYNVGIGDYIQDNKGMDYILLDCK